MKNIINDIQSFYKKMSVCIGNSVKTIFLFVISIFLAIFMLLALSNLASAVIVDPGESIQNAINSLPAEGGLVELLDGTYNLTSPLWINKSNVTLMGQGMDKSIINQVAVQTDGIIVSKYYDYGARDTWLYNNGIKWEVQVQWFKDHPDEVVNNATINHLTINTHGSIGRFSGVGAVEITNLTVSKVKIQGDATTNQPRGVFISHFIDATVEDSVIDGVGEGLTMHGGSYRGNVINNTISNTKQWTVIQYNGVSGKDGIDALIKNNTLINNQGCLYVYSSSNVNVTGNTVSDTYYRYGIWINLPTGRIEVNNNKVWNVHYDDYSLAAGIGVEQKYIHFIDSIPVNINNNLIYNNEKHGIRIWHSSAYKNMSGAILSNTIYNNGADGINNYQDQPLDAVRNNIIVNNTLYGLVNISDNSCNCVWNNMAGNYQNTPAGTGSISSDPLFVDVSTHDFHLKSQYGRWDDSGWVNDGVTSPGIDAGDPYDAYSNEPEPNGSRINMGVYGNSVEASKSSFASTPPMPNENNEMKIYPNPYIKRKINEDKITFANLPPAARIRIYAVSGELVETLEHKDIADGGSEEWDVSEIAGGVYVYTIIFPEGKKTGKVSIVK